MKPFTCVTVGALLSTLLFFIEAVALSITSGGGGTNVPFKTWLVSLNADSSFHSFHGGLTWNFISPDLATRQIVQLNALPAGTDPSRAEYQDLIGSFATSIPEPSGVALLGTGILVLFGCRRRRGDRAPGWYGTLLLVLLPLTIGLVIAAPPSHATFIDHVGLQSADDFTSIWSWDFTSRAPNTNVVAGPNWHREVQSTAGVNVQNLTLKVRHLAPPPHTGDALENPAAPAFNQIVMNNLARPTDPLFPNAEKVFAQQFTHPGLGHFDVLSLSASVPREGNAAVVGAGKHSDAALANWSYRPIFKGFIEVSASYNTGANRIVEPGRSVVEGFLERGTLTPAGETRRPTDYVIKFTGSPTTELTLAFLGQADGVPGKLDLMAGIDFFGGPDGILAPMFDDAASTPVGLFAAVDLVEWLGLSSSMPPEGPVSINAGRSPLLPGYLFSTSPITFDAVNGYLTSQPFTGEIRLVGTVDGTIVPEPSSLTLLVIGWLVLVCRHRRKVGGIV